MKTLSFRQFSIAQRLWITAGIILAIVLIWLTLPRPANVESAAIDRGVVRRTILDEGRTRIHDVFVISAPVSGLLQRIDLHPGDAVSRGEIVATVLPADPALLDARLAAETSAAVAAAQSALAAAEASADLARRDQNRVAQLAKGGFVSQAALDGANAGLRAARANVAARRADLRRAQVAAGSGGARAYTPFKVPSPASGQVLRVLEESEGVIAVGTPVLEIGDPKNLEIVAEFLSQDSVLIHAGAAAYLEGWGGEPPLPARVSRIEPYAHTKISALGVEEQRVNVILRLADSKTAPPLGHGYRLDVRVVVDEFPNALRVPTDALVRSGADWAVYRIAGGRVRFTPIRVGIGDEHFRAVLQGLSVDDRVVLFPRDSLKDGARVRVSSKNQ